ncbi:MAG: hypothetical protein G01um101470_1003 [Parcubacteria group bacterium Gr01-1014_70]|nr:MAG: hypothetical protein G01um101470_1003 [Parcubacteria group bacterium Gr01-1014_70]
MKTLQKDVELPRWVGAIVKCDACGHMGVLEETDKVDPKGGEYQNFQAFHESKSLSYTVVCPKCNGVILFFIKL